MPATKTDKGKDIWVFLAFLFVSFCLWLMKVTNENFETSIPVGITVRHLPAGVELEDDDIEIEVGVRAKGSKLLAYRLWKECGIAVSYSDFADNGDLLSMPTSKLANNVEGSLPAFFSFKYFEDDSLVLRIRKESAVLPVLFTPVIVAGDNVEYGGYVLNADTVRVTAPPAMLARMENVRFVTDSLLAVAKDTLLRYELPQRRYFCYEPAVLTARISAAPYSLVKVKRRLQANGCDEGLYELPDSVTVSCLVPPSMASRIGSGHFMPYLSAGGNDTLFVKVASMPPFVNERSVKAEPGYVLARKKKPFRIFGIFN